jgi:hypothetical protein
MLDWLAVVWYSFVGREVTEEEGRSEEDVGEQER